MDTYKKIIFYFLIGIVIPYILTVYLALRGIRNEQALIEKESANLYSEFSTQIRTSIYDFIKYAKNSFLYNLSFLNTNNIESIDKLNILLKKDFPNSICFVYERKKGIIFPKHNLLYFRDTLKDPKPLLLFPINHYAPLKNAYKFEFEEHPYNNKTLTVYRKMIKFAKDKSDKARILYAIARLQKKLKHPIFAKKTYRKIISEYNGVILGCGIVAGPICNLELSNLLYENGKYDQSIQVAFRLFQNLINAKWFLYQSQFLFLFNKTFKLINKLIVVGNPNKKNFYLKKLADLMILKNKKLRITEDLLVFQKNINEYMNDFSKKYYNSSRKYSFHKFSITSDNNKSYMVIMMVNHGSDPKRFWGLLLNWNNLRKYIMSQFIERNLYKYKIPIDIKMKNGKSLYKNPKIDLQNHILIKNFITDFPPLKINFYGKP